MAQYCEKAFPASVDALDGVIAFLEAQLESHESALRAQTQILVAAEEIFVNIAHYAYEKQDGQALVRCAFDPETRVFCVTFVDSGRPYNPLSRTDPDVTLSAEAREIGGLGVWMVKKTMDRVGYAHEDGKNIFTMEKAI